MCYGLFTGFGEVGKAIFLFENRISGAMTMICSFPRVENRTGQMIFLLAGQCRAYVADRSLSMPASMKSIVWL